MSDTTNAENQVGPCGILCGSCPLGNGQITETARRTREYIRDCQIPVWAPLVPGGDLINWDHMDKGLEWMAEYACCNGCEMGGGPPDCTIRICARERGYQLCSSCEDLDSCNKFDWLKEHGSQLKKALQENKGLSKEEHARIMAEKMPWNS